MVTAGAANLVAGTSSIFHASASMSENVARIRQAIDQGLAQRI
jgi:hypothetical protein